MFPFRSLVANTTRSSITVSGFMLPGRTRSGPSLPVALCIAITLRISVALRVPVALCISIPTSVGPSCALRAGLSLRSRRAADGQQHQKTRTHKQRSLHFDSPLWRRSREVMFTADECT
jgi:hypothetical protein